VSDAPSRQSDFSIRVVAWNPSVLYTWVNDKLFKSVNGGDSWAAITLKPSDLGIHVVVIDPRNPDVVYIGGGDGVFKSINGGGSWSPSRPRPHDISVRALVIDPLDNQIIYAAGEAGSMYVSTTGGETWSQMNEGLLGLNNLTLAVDPSGSGMVYLGTWGDGIYKRRFIIPQVTNVVFDPWDTPEKLTIFGRRFGASPRVLINGADRTTFIVSVSDASLKLKGKASGMNLRAGENTIQIIGTDGAVSNIFILRL
jgi:hypothetical protein